MAIGDWGGSAHSPYYTQAQKINSDGMAKVADMINPEAVISLGDNFYYVGLSLDNVDERYKATFEDIYSQPSLASIPWFSLAGNHDYYGNVDLQVELSKIHQRWKFPSLFYDQTFNWAESSEVYIEEHGEMNYISKNYSLDLIVIDTAVLAGLAENFDTPFPQPPGPKDPVLAQKWYDWIEERLNRSNADYIWIAGHYPVYSVCWQGSTIQLLDKLQPLLNKYQANYMAGHDHCQLHLDDNSTGVNYLLTGMGHSCCYGERNDSAEPGSIASPEEKEALIDAQSKLKFKLSAHTNPTHAAAGFASITANSNRMKISIHDQNGEYLYTSEDILPRSVLKNIINQQNNKLTN